MNKPVYLGPSILQLSKILMYKFWYDYVCWKSKLCFMVKFYCINKMRWYL